MLKHLPLETNVGFVFGTIQITRLYTYSPRYDGGGITNFGIEPRGSHRIFVGDGQGNICWQYGTPIGTPCPNSVRITAWSGNCP